MVTMTTRATKKLATCREERKSLLQTAGLPKAPLGVVRAQLGTAAFYVRGCLPLKAGRGLQISQITLNFLPAQGLQMDSSAQREPNQGAKWAWGGRKFCFNSTCG